MVEILIGILVIRVILIPVLEQKITPVFGRTEREGTVHLSI